MTAKQVDLVHYVNGQRVVVGKAVVEFDGEHFDITGKITHDDGTGLYGGLVEDLKHISIGRSKRPGVPYEAGGIPVLDEMPRKKQGRGKRW